MTVNWPLEMTRQEAVPRIRLDDLLVERGLAADRDEAERLIRAGEIFSASGHRLTTPGFLIDPQIHLERRGRAGLRGSEKLRGALESLSVDVKGKTCVDIGASTGGFTSLLLDRGAGKVYAIDVGKGQLKRQLAEDERVVVMDETNARYLDGLPEPVDLVTIDVSFISLSKILPAVKKVIDAQGKPAEVLVLVKPQFEVGREVASRFKGVISDPKLQREAVERVKRTAEELGFEARGQAASALKGPKGNQEYFLYLTV
jgi:23S rRNA (cytidine1920-2'-O)/16S rRNA (cytidine1409-2'-O)-methyltransferase